MMIGNEMHEFARELWPINRSLTGNGVRETLGRIRQYLPGLEVFEVPSGSKAFDWVVPKEWAVKSAWIKTPSGETICDFSKNNLHLVGYSIPFSGMLKLQELQNHLYSLPDMPTAIPYITSYYQERWGFCLSQYQRDQLKDGQYEVHIDSELFDGHLTYGEYLVKGRLDSEVFLSTYICHPSMANDELSGPVVTSYIAKFVSELLRPRYSYRFVFIPETIGSLTYLSRNLDHLRRNVVAGFNVSCVGDERAYSYLPSRAGTTISDRVAKHVLSHIAGNYEEYGWADRGSDERQYCAPGVDLPIATIMRSKYGRYPEYHTSLDDLETVVTPDGLLGGYKALKFAIECLEANVYPKATQLGEPQMGSRGLYPTLSTTGSGLEVRTLMDILSWSDGKHSVLDIAEKCEKPAWEIAPMVKMLVDHELLTLSDH
jgi:aminopeptidase-like protein